MENEKQETQFNEPSNAPAAALADLAVIDEQAQQVVGGEVLVLKRFRETVEPTGV